VLCLLNPARWADVYFLEGIAQDPPKDTQMSQSSRKTWVSIVIASVIIIGMLAVAIVGGTAFFFYRHIDTQFTPQKNAEQQFAAARSRFEGRQPLIEMRFDDEPILHRELMAKANSATKLETLRILAYDPRAHKLVRVSVPFWLIRLAPSKHFSFNDNGFDFDSDNVRLTVDDLERLGPGLILDQKDRRGSHVLVWTE
jgi:nitrate reductase NapE component